MCADRFDTRKDALYAAIFRDQAGNLLDFGKLYTYGH